MYFKYFFFLIIGTSRDSTDQSGAAHANPGAASHDHGCTGKVRNPPSLSFCKLNGPQTILESDR